MGRFVSLLALLLVGSLLLPGQVVRASCLAAAPADLIERAHVIAHGQVVQVDMREDETLTLVTLDRVYKGSPENPILLKSAYGRNVATSVDYRLQMGTDHTLYLRKGPDGFYTTNACSGSHPGTPTPEEIALLGKGEPAPEPQSVEEEAAEFRWRFWVPFIAVGVTVGAMGLVLLSIRREPSE